MHIGILEDDLVQRELLTLLVENGEHSCKAYGTVASFTEALKQETFDLALIDWMLPDGNGGDVLQWIRKNIGWQLPSIVITAREEESVVVSALEAGADDYIVKPAKPRELLARIAAASRRARPGTMPVLRAGDYEVGSDVLVERKSVIDLHGSIERGRFCPQIGKLRYASAFPFLLIEGEDIDKGPLSQKAIRGACIAVIHRGIRLVQTTDQNDSALWLERLAVRAAKYKPVDRPSHSNVVGGNLGTSPAGIAPLNFSIQKSRCACGLDPGLMPSNSADVQKPDPGSA
jgi:CheY-like chemotaxis protein